MAYADWINHLAGAAVGGLKGFLICAVMVTLDVYKRQVFSNTTISRGEGYGG